MCHHVLLELSQELLGFGERKAQLFESVAGFLQHRYGVDRVRSIIICANDQLPLHPHVTPSPLNVLTMELTLLSVKGYPRFLMPSAEGVYALEPPPVLILLDLKFPKLDGHQVLAEVRRLPAYQATPVMVFGATRTEMEEQRCLHLRANAYMQKPADFDGFFATARTMVRTWLESSGG